MSSIAELRIGDVRCFDGEQSVKTRRITLLVGENNAGKSTALSCYHALSRIAYLEKQNRLNYFDDTPLHMGTFDTIARSGSSKFTLGGSLEGHIYTNIMCEFGPHKHNVPHEKRVRIEFKTTGNESRSLDMELVSNSETWRIKGPEFSFDLDHSEISYVSILEWLSRYVRHGNLPYSGKLDEFRNRTGVNESPNKAAKFEKLTSLFRSALPLPCQNPFSTGGFDPSIVPPDRTYATLPHEFNNLSREQFDRLNEMGNELNLWKDITIRSRTEDSRYEVLVKTASDWQTLAAVGYGIHSVLPLIATICDKKQRTTFLLQQPETHLHPSTQANLAQIMAESEHNFVIETHSDHIVDRFRICVMNGVLRPDELSIAYFSLSPDRKSSQIHNLGIDAEGNLSNAPSGYRSFFMRETKSLLGFQ